MNKKKKYNVKIGLIILLTLLCLIVMVKKVSALLSAYTRTEGKKAEPVTISGGKIDYDTQINGNTLNVIIKNQGQIENYLRVKVFSVLPVELIGNDWEKNEDGYYYSKQPIKPGETMQNLSFKISSDNSNIITVMESTLVLYGKYNETYANWNRKLEM